MILTDMPINVAGIDTNPGLCLLQVGGNGMYIASATMGDAYRRWNTGGTRFNGFTTILPPNAPSCAPDDDDNDWGIVSPTSYHPGGVNVMIADGSVRFIGESINTGNLAAKDVGQGRSPYGVWGALGSKNGGEAVSVP